MRLAFLILAVGALGACGRTDSVAEDANTDSLPVINEDGPNPSGEPPANAANASAAAAPVPAISIPPALQGRWGLAPGDCTSTRGDAKGLLVVEPDKLRFYESRAVPAANVQTSANSVSGDFAFTGEGQTWTKHQTLELRDGRLVRTDRDPIARFRYVRC